MSRQTREPRSKRMIHQPQEVQAPRGQPLDPALRAALEPRFRHNFSEVRIHADAEADRLARVNQAHAFAYGNDLFFRHGAYDPSSSRGMYTLTHELTHVVQQHDAPKRDAPEGTTHAQPGDPSEREAHRAARDVMAGRNAGVTAGSAAGAEVARIGEEELMSLVPTELPATQLPPEYLTSPAIPRAPGLPSGNMGGYDSLLESAASGEETALAEGAAIETEATEAIMSAEAMTAETIPAAAAGGGEAVAGAELAEGAAATAGEAGAGAVALPLLAGLAAFLWPNSTAPAWMDEMNPNTGQPYQSEAEYRQVKSR